MSKPSVVVVGANGVLGPHVLKALVSENFKSLYQLPIRVVTRDASKSSAISGDDFKYYTADLLSGEGLEEAFKDVDVVINLLGTKIPHTKVADAAAAAKAKLYFPSEYGTDIENSGEYKNLFKIKIDALAYARSLGLKAVAINCGAFAEFILTVPPFFGINFPEPGKFTYYGDLSTKLSITSLVDVGKVIASVAAKDPSTIPDKVVFSGQNATIEQIKEAYEKAAGTTLEPIQLPLSEVTGPALEVAKRGAQSELDFLTGLKGAVYAGAVFHVPAQNEFVSKGLFTFTPIDEAAKYIVKK